jgi:hypothetical protein
MGKFLTDRMFACYLFVRKGRSFVTLTWVYPRVTSEHSIAQKFFQSFKLFRPVLALTICCNFFIFQFKSNNKCKKLYWYSSKVLLPHRSLSLLAFMDVASTPSLSPNDKAVDSGIARTGTCHLASRKIWFKVLKWKVWNKEDFPPLFFVDEASI